MLNSHPTLTLRNDSGKLLMRSAIAARGWKKSLKIFTDPSEKSRNSPPQAKIIGNGLFETWKTRKRWMIFYLDMSLLLPGRFPEWPPFSGNLSVCTRHTLDH